MIAPHQQDCDREVTQPEGAAPTATSQKLRGGQGTAASASDMVASTLQVLLDLARKDALGQASADYSLGAQVKLYQIMTNSHSQSLQERWVISTVTFATQMQNGDSES